MKRFIAILFSLSMILLIASCKKEEEQPKTTYTVIINTSALTDSATTRCDFTAYEYDENEEMMAFNDILRGVKGTQETFIAHSNSAKVKMYLEFYADAPDFPRLKYWDKEVYYLEKDNNIEIIISDATRLVKSEPF